MMKIVIFHAGSKQEALPADLPRLLEARQGTLWVDIGGPEEEDVRIMREVFRFHPLAIEDTLNQQQRPKVEEYADHLFLILNPMSFDQGQLDLRELDLFVGANYLVSVHSGEEPTLERVHQRLAEAGSAIPISPSYLMYLIMDVVIDNYFPLLDTIGEEVERIEDAVLAEPSRELLNRLFHIKRVLLEMWRIVWPQRDVFNKLAYHNLPFIDQATLRHYLRDVSDHLLWIADMVSTFRDTLSSIMDLYMSAISNRLNAVVNRLTVFALVIGVMTVVGGFYGMNFAQTWPPFAAWWGVPFVLGLMVVLTAALLVIFRKLGWY